MIGYNHFLSFKGRRPDCEKPVFLYRNLNGDEKHLYSLKQGGLVVGHTNRMVLTDVAFRVSKAGQARVRRTKTKNVHAYIVGKIAKKGAMGSDGLDAHRWPVKVEYNPYRDRGFMWREYPDKPLEEALAIVASTKGVFAAYVD